jgi:2,4-dienoyl-CoA reductase-like NADH-dependent reductase (Old Yellow Enzyme family)
MRRQALKRPREGYYERMRLPLEVVWWLRETIPEPRSLFMRISATDWVEGG